MPRAEVSGNGSGVGVAGATSEDQALVRSLIGLLAFGVFLVLIGLGVSAVFDLGPPDGVGLGLLVEYGSRGLGVLGVAASLGAVAFGFLWTALHVIRGLIKGLISTIRFLVEHDLRHLLGFVAPTVLPVSWFVGFSLLTGGTDAIGYWLLAALGSVVLGIGGYYSLLLPYYLLWQLGDGLGSLVAALVSRDRDEPSDKVKEAVSIAVRIGPLAVLYVLVWVIFAANYSGTTPSRLPWTESGWGQFLGFLTLVGTTWGMGSLGWHLHDRWTEAEEVEDDSPAVAPIPTVPTPAIPMTVPSPVVVLSETEPEELWSPEAILGWRAWLWTGEELRGVWRSWTTAVFEAECTLCDEVPGWGHTCGVYAVKRRWKLHVFDRPAVRDRMVIGRVELTGLVVEHEAGYRAQRARIVELIAHPYLVAQIRSIYPDVDVKEGPENGVLWPT